MMGMSIDPEDETPLTPDENKPEDSLDNPFDPFLPDETSDDIPEWLQMDLENSAIDEDLPDWLQPPDSDSDTLPDWLRTPTDTSDTPPDEQADALLQDAILPPLDDLEPLDDLLKLDEVLEQDDSEDDGSLSWLDQVASGDLDALEEPPTLHWPDSESPPIYMEGVVESNIQLPDSPIDELNLPQTDSLPPADTVLDELTLPDLEMGELVDDIELGDLGMEDWLQGLGDTSELLPDVSLDEPEQSTADQPIAEKPSKLVEEEVPEDLDDAMAWLEQLAAKQGAPLDELPTVDELPKMPEPVAEVEPVVEQEVDLFEEEMVVDLPSAEMDELASSVPEDPEEAMAWLEQLAAKQGAPLDELPTVDELPRVDELPKMPEPVTEVELPEPEAEVEAEAEVESVVVDELEIEAEMPAMPTETDEVPEDLDDAMAWLEQLAAKQGAPLDELPTVDELPDMPEPVAEVELPEPEAEVEAEAEVESVVVDELEIEAEIETGMPAITTETDEVPEDLDDAMAWLEQLAAKQGAPLDELPTVDEMPRVDELPKMPEPVAEVELPEPVAEEAKTVELPVVESDSELDALAWLDDLAPPMDFETESSSIEATKSKSLVPEAPEVDEDEFGLDDSDKALAWLERLALTDDEGELINALPKSSEPPAQPVESPEEVVPVPEPVSEAETVLEVVPASATEPDSEPETPTAPPEPIEPEQPETEAGSDSLITELTGQDVGDMPDWLDWESDSSDLNVGGDAWLDSLDDSPDLLTSEEDVISETGELAPINLPASGALEAPSKPPTGPLERPVDVDTTSSLLDTDTASERQAISDNVRLNAGILQAARQAVDEGDFATATNNYTELVEAGEDLPMLVTDLQFAISRHRRQPLLHRVLGDAYVQQGELQKALDVYRDVLNQL